MRWPLLCASCICAGIALLPAGPQTVPAARRKAPATAAAPVAALPFDSTVKPFLGRHCTGCHNPKAKSAGLDLTAYADAASVLKNEGAWENVMEKLRAGEMPPKGLPRPPAADVKKVADWIEGELNRAAAARKPDPGRVTARRLNRTEYNYTIQDLLAVDVKPADDFPNDDSGYGFDNIGDVLSISPVLMEKYVAAAEKVARIAVQGEPKRRATAERYQAERETRPHPGRYAIRHKFPITAEYELRGSVSGRRPLGSTNFPFALALDGKTLGEWEVNVAPDNKRTFEVRIPVTAGEHMVQAYIPGDPRTYGDREGAQRDKYYVVDLIEIRGPFPSDAEPESRKRIFVCGTQDDACARQIAAHVARRAWRRPVTEAETARLAGFVALARQDGEPFDRGVEVMLQAILVSPHFLFRIERDPKPGDAAAVHTISDLELASRLSYFLWSSLPDEPLLQAAEQGALRRPEALRAQIARMLADPKIDRLVENFAGQWLQLRNIESIKPDPELFPEFDEELRAAMQQETRHFFANLVKEDRSILEFLSADYTYLNERLAKHYGVEGVKGGEFRRVELAGSPRKGVLTHAGILTLSSYPTRTSPVLRGKWILENILNAPPPPPPPGVPELDAEKVGLAGNMKQQLSQHRANAACAVCHDKIDPLGFGLESFDAIGRFRTMDGKFPVDASGDVNGKPFDGAAEMMAILGSNPDAFSRCVTEKLLTYALGRGLERYDKPAIQLINRRLAQGQYRFSTLIWEIVNSMPFQMRRGEGGKS